MSAEQLKPEWDEFAQLYTAGPEELRGNAKACYRRVYGCSETAAESGGSRLLQREEVRARIRELREVAAEAARDRMREWGELLPEAQSVVLAVARGEYAADDDNGRARLRAATHIIDRAVGTVKEQHRLEVEGSEMIVRVAGAPHPPQEEYQGDPEELADGDGRRVVEARSRDGRDSRYEGLDAQLQVAGPEREGRDQEEEHTGE